MRTEPDIEINFTKWGGKQHWRYVMELLGTDEYGEWFGARAGTPTQRGHEPPTRAQADYVVLAPVAGHWIATWNAGIEPAIYVDVTTARTEPFDKVGDAWLRDFTT